MCKRRPTNHQQVAETITLYNQNKTVSQISELLGVQYSTTAARIKAYKKQKVCHIEDNDVTGIHPCLTLFGGGVHHAI